MFSGLSPFFLVSGGLDQGILPNQKKWLTNSCLLNPESDKSELRISDVANDKTRERVETKQNPKQLVYELLNYQNTNYKRIGDNRAEPRE